MITADIERAMNRVKNRNDLFRSMAQTANDYYSTEATLTFGEPTMLGEPKATSDGIHKRGAMPVQADVGGAYNNKSGAHIAVDGVHDNSGTKSVHSEAKAAHNAAAHAVPVADSMKIQPKTETTLPNQTKNLVINEFEIHPERPVMKRNVRRNNFGFTLSPIISVGRPNRK